jgi:cytosine/adenosine deaminase-related metal-dependent hydrolase
MLFIRVVLVPFWQGSPPHQFRAWFAAHSERIRGLMVPLGSAAAATAVTTAVAEAARGGDARTSTAVAAVSAVGVGVITSAVNEPANHQFVRQDLDDDETVRLLHRWAQWHDVRVVLGVVSALAAARTLASRS